jgi:hypothetical protein
MRHEDGNWGSSNWWRVMVENNLQQAHVIANYLSEQAAENIVRQYRRDSGPRYWIERM